MKLFLICAAVLSVGVPTVTIPASADAQVLAGRGAARAASRAPRVSREDRLTNRLVEAEDRLLEIDERIAEIRSTGETAGALTPAQERQLAQLNQRREREQREIDRLNQELGA